MGNLILNPGFEAGLKGWTVNNVFSSNENPYEGTAVARMGPGIATLVQKVKLKDNDEPLQLSFAVQSFSSFDPGDLSITVEWLDKKGHLLCTDVRLIIPSSTIGNQLFWLTYTDVTNDPPKHAKKARVVFSKALGADTNNDMIDIDNVLLTIKEE